MTNGEVLTMLGFGTALMLPNLVAVPITQALLRRMQRVAAVAVTEAEGAMDIDLVPVQHIVRGVVLSLESAPAVAEGLIEMLTKKAPGVQDEEAFDARNDRLVRASMTAVLSNRILSWVAAPYGLRRFSAALDAGRILLFSCDAAGCVVSQEAYNRFLAKHPPEKSPERIVVAA